MPPTRSRSFTAASLAGKRFELHPVQQSSADPVVRSATYKRSTGTFRVPALTTAVFAVAR